MIELTWQAMMGVGLAASAGLRAFLPLLMVSLAGRFELIGLGDRFTWMASDAAIIVFAVAVVVEVLGDKIPIVDHGLDTVGAFARPVAGALVAASPITTMEPLTGAVVALILGAGIAGGVHAAKSGLRLFSTGTTAGLASPVISTVEDAVSFTAAAMAILVPGLLLLFALLLAALLYRRTRRRAALV